MKKLFKSTVVVLILLGLVFFVSQANALDWYTANQKTVAWTPVTTMDNGKPIPEGSTVKYQTYLARSTDPDKKNLIDTGIVDAAEKTFTLNEEGKFYPCIQSLRYINDEQVGQSTAISCSDDPIVCKDGKTFGLKFYLIPDAAVDVYPKTQ